MEISRVAKVCEALVSEAKSVELTALIKRVTEALLSRDLQNIRHEVESVRVAYSQSPIDRLRPTSSLLLRKMGGSHLTGEILANRIVEIALDRTIRPEHASQLLSAIREDSETLVRRAQQFLSATVQLNLKDSEEGEAPCEVGFSYPARKFPDLEAFQKEVAQLDRSLRALSEAVGHRGSLKLRELSTGSFEIALDSPVVLAIVVAKIIDWVMSVRERDWEIQKLVQEVREKKLANDVAEGIEAERKRVAAEAIMELEESIANSAPEIDAGRMNELRIAISGAISHLSSIVDEGAIVEVTIRPSSLSTPEESEAVSTEALRRIDGHGKRFLEMVELRDRQLLGPGEGSEK